MLPRAVDDEPAAESVRQVEPLIAAPPEIACCNGFDQNSPMLRGDYCDAARPADASHTEGRPSH
jgi:hypothetical protein